MLLRYKQWVLHGVARNMYYLGTGVFKCICLLVLALFVVPSRKMISCKCQTCDVLYAATLSPVAFLDICAGDEVAVAQFHY